MSMTILALVQALDAAPGVQGGLTAGSLAFMLICMGAVAGLTAWCFSRILSTKDHFDPDGTGPAKTPVRGEKDIPG